MISRVLIIASGGMLCYSKTFAGKFEVEEDLISGFLTAISNIAIEIKAGGVKSLNFRNFNYIFSYDNDLDCLFVIVTDIDDLEEEARKKVELMKDEFIKRYRQALQNWTGEVSLFDDFEEYVEEYIYIPPKILLIGEAGVGKTTIMDLFPGETVLELDEDLNEIIQKSITLTGFKNLKQCFLREIDLENLVNNTKLYRQILDTVDIICVVTNSAATNLTKTKQLLSRIKDTIKKADFYIIGNFQDLKSSSFEPKKIEIMFGIKTYGFSAIKKDAKERILAILTEMLKISVLERIEKKQRKKS